MRDGEQQRSNLAARDATGRLTALKASLTSVMGQDYVLGCKVGFVMLTPFF